MQTRHYTLCQFKREYLEEAAESRKRWDSL